MFERHDSPEMDRSLLEGAWRFQVVAPLVRGSLNHEERKAHRKVLLSNPLIHPWLLPLKLHGRIVPRLDGHHWVVAGGW